MLNLIFRPAALRAHARFETSALRAHARFRLTAWRVPAQLFAWTCVGALLAPVAMAAEAASPNAAIAPPFNQYQGWRDEPLMDWREANARVGEIGGWRTYLRESQEGGGAAAGGKPSAQPGDKANDKPGSPPSDKPGGPHSQHGQ